MGITETIIKFSINSVALMCAIWPLYLLFLISVQPNFDFFFKTRGWGALISLHLEATTLRISFQQLYNYKQFLLLLFSWILNSYIFLV